VAQLPRTIAARRVRRPTFPGELVGPVTEGAIERQIPVALDEEMVLGIRIDSDGT
jgi:hypothetical protein